MRSLLFAVSSSTWVLLACLAILGVILATLAPFNFQHLGRLADTSNFLAATGSDGWFEPLANVLLFMPLGFTLGGWAMARRWRWAWTFAFVLMVGFILTSTVEFLQVALPGRHSSRWDIYSNTLGTLLGFAGIRALFLWIDQGFRRVLIEVLSAYVVLFLAGSIYLAPTSYHWGLSNWQPDMPLNIGNEATGNRAWRGRMERLVLRLQTLSSDTDAAALRALLSDGLGAFSEMPMSTGADVLLQIDHGLEIPLAWRPYGEGIFTETGPCLRRTQWLQARDGLEQRVREIIRTSGFSAGVVFRARHLRQAGPARIFGLSEDISTRNMTVGQVGRDLIIRIRTPFTGLNGSGVQFRIPDAVYEERSSMVFLSYEPGRIRAFVGEELRPLAFDVTPEQTLLWAPARLPESITVTLGAPAKANAPLAYYLILCIPLGILLGIVYEHQHWVKRLLAGAALLVGVLFMMQLLFAGLHSGGVRYGDLGQGVIVGASAFAAALLLDVIWCAQGTSGAARRR